jgi:DMT family permease
MINNEKIKRIGFVLIGIANFILLPFFLMYFSGKMTWYGIIYFLAMSGFFTLGIFLGHRRFIVPRIIERHIIPRDRKSYYIISLIAGIIAVILFVILIIIKSDFDKIISLVGSVWVVWVTIIIYLRETRYFKLW